MQQKVDVKARATRFIDATANVVEHVVQLICVFLLQTLVIPIILGWALLRGAAAAMRVQARF